jgi:RNA ligase
MPKLLTRDEFREAVFKRDNYKCVICGNSAQDAYHIIERRLWGDSQGYFLENGSSLCGQHHLECEMTLISCEEVRQACGITKTLIPDYLYDEYTYDKWGNIILDENRRVKGELFHDESVQKVLKQGGVLNKFIPYVKYQRTFHLPWSQSINKDDRVLPNVNHFKGKPVIVTTKMDGECTSMYPDYIHARSIDSKHHESRDWVKNFWNNIRWDIPSGYRLVGENIYAEHSLHYKNLDSYFMLFSIWDDTNICLSWKDTIEWAELLGVEVVPVLYEGIFDETLIKGLWDESKWDTMEGYVVRLADSFPYSVFSKSIAKFVRKNHVQTTKHNWQTQPVIPNELKKKNK